MNLEEGLEFGGDVGRELDWVLWGGCVTHVQLDIDI
jgi:hypothetical protein